MTGKGWVKAAAIAALAMSAVSAHGQASNPAHRWESYANARYAYAICYPADLLDPQREADNGDGRVFQGRAGVSLRVFGHYNAAEQSMAAAIASDAAAYGREGVAISYKASRAGWYVLSGKAGDMIVYRRTIAASDDRRLTFELRYPAAQATVWNPVVARLGKCFAAG